MKHLGRPVRSAPLLLDRLFMGFFFKGNTLLVVILSQTMSFPSCEALTHSLVLEGKERT